MFNAKRKPSVPRILGAFFLCFYGMLTEASCCCYRNQATDNHEIVIVTRKGEKNVVIMSLEKYNQLEKAARNAEYLAMIDREITQLLAGKGQEHELIEADE